MDPIVYELYQKFILPVNSYCNLCFKKCDEYVDICWKHEKIACVECYKMNKNIKCYECYLESFEKITSKYK